MTARLLAGLLFLSPPLLSTQTPAPQYEVTKNLVCSRGSDCGFGHINGRRYESLASDKIGVVVVVDVVANKYIRAEVFVLNKGDKNVDVLPSNMIMTEVLPKQKGLKYVDADKLIRSGERKLAWGNALTAMGGSMARQQSTTTTNSYGTINAIGSNGATAMGTYSGASTSTTSAPDYAAQARAAQTIQMRNEAFASLASAASRGVLRANTVPPTQSVLGFLLFENDKKAKEIMLSAIVGNTIYQFPFDRTIK